MPEIEVHDLRKTYPGDVEALKGIDFQVESGEVFGLLGPNGAGKSTTIGILTTTVKPTGGTARLGGYDVVAQPLQARSVSSVVFQEAVVDGSLTGRQNLELHARLWGIDAGRTPRRIDELGRALGISDLVDRRVDGYSGGQRRRLEIARALVSHPQVLFLDEPTVGLDPRIRQELLDVIAELRASEEVTILVTTHYLDEAARLADRVAIVRQGEFVAIDTPRALLAGLGEQVLEFRAGRDAEAALQALRDNGTAGADAFVLGPRVTVPLHGGPAAALEAIESEPVRASEIQVRAPTLDDVYIQLTGTGLRESPGHESNGTRFGETDPIQN